MGNPYAGCDFFSFFTVLLRRIFLGGEGLASDEIQMIVLVAIALSGALVGTFLVLRRMAMLANALSHTILLGIVVVYLLVGSFAPLPLMVASLVTALLTTCLTTFLTQVAKLQEDASTGLVFTLLFALGIVLVSMVTRNAHIGTELVMGNVDALTRGDIPLVLMALVLNILLFSLFYPSYKITTFDPQLARTFGFSPLFFNYLLMVQTSTTAIGGFRAVGVLMILAFFVLPPLTARLLTHRLPILIALAAGIGAFASICGVALSRHILSYYGVGLSTAGIVVTLLGLLFVLVICIKSFDGSRAQILLSVSDPARRGARRQLGKVVEGKRTAGQQKMGRIRFKIFDTEY